MTTVQRHEIETWLGDALADMTPEQVDRVHRAARQIEDRYPDPDDGGEREAALSAALAYILGDATLSDVGEDLLGARIAQASALAAAQQVALMAVEDGVPEAVAARQVALSRMTVRKVRGLR